MQEHNCSFHSDGLELDASFFLPDEEPDPELPVIVGCSGFLGLKDIHPERFARWFTRSGYVCFGFDYRGFADSEGEPGHVVLDEQVRDIAHALAYVRSDERSGDRPIVVIGWGMGAGLVLRAARSSPALAGIVTFNGFYDAVRVQRALRGDDGYEAFRSRVRLWNEEAARTGEARLVNPFEIYPLDPVTTEYVDDVLYRNPDFGDDVWTGMAMSLLDHAPERNLDHLEHTPLLVLHGDSNALHPVTEATSLHDAYPGPKTLRWIDDAGHTEWMLDEHPTFQTTMTYMQSWIEELG